MSAARSAEELVRRLVTQPPTRLSALEHVVGVLDLGASEHDAFGLLTRPALDVSGPVGILSPFVRGISLQYVFDIHHERPYSRDDGRSVRDPALWRYTVTLQIGRFSSWSPGGIRGWLETFAGTPERIAESPSGPVLRFRDVYWFEGAPEQLTWYAAPPDWAHPKPSLEARIRWIAALAEQLRGGCDHAGLVTFFDAMPEAVGVRFVGVMNRDDAQFVLEPKMEARDFARALGFDETFAFSGDVHRSTWELYVPAGPGDVHRHVLPRLGEWRVSAVLDGWPRPAADAEAPEGGSVGFEPAYDLARCAPSFVGPLRIAPMRGRPAGDDRMW